MFKLKKLFGNNTKKLDQLPINTIIAEGVSVTGNIKGKKTIRIDGSVDGNVDMVEGIILGAKSFIKGSLSSNSVIIHGKLTGDLTCQELHIKNTGVIEGNIIVDLLKVDMGGRYSGSLKMDMKNPIESPEDILFETSDNPLENDHDHSPESPLYLAKIKKR